MCKDREADEIANFQNGRLIKKNVKLQYLYIASITSD